MSTVPIVALVGGTGFIGQATMHALLARGCHIRLISRHKPTFSLPDSVTWHAADTAHPDSLISPFQGCTSVIHLVAVLAERGQPFTHTILQSTVNTVQAAHTAQVAHFVYVSALEASPTSPSRYTCAKGMAENAVRTFYPFSTIARPSLVIGDGGGFRQQIDLLTRYMPIMVLPGMGHSRFQPIDVQSVAETLAKQALTPPHKAKTLLLAGPHVYTFRQLAQTELSRLKRQRIFLPLPWWVTWLIAYAFHILDRLTCYRLIPLWLLVTPDQVSLLKQENIVTSPK
ncbi:MAG: NAD-dependent epimerase/dehydratase family protein [Blastochloris viridis]|uniref:NAD-dependent epimerase/dehydratase family protein n=1 Tax=Blastochloris viridis TaxID=1079 RepID=A0A6N4R4G2_BLAVI|nr:MAG: NAD-dependent epimerase/dehydratase family protein [Blastochloris viridis]